MQIMRLMMIVMINTLQSLLKKEIENIIFCKCVFLVLSFPFSQHVLIGFNILGVYNVLACNSVF